MYVIKAAQLIAQAEVLMSRYPQYKGRFDNMIMVRIKKEQNRTLGKAFEAGEISIADPEPIMSKNVKNGKVGVYMNVWSFKNEIMTSVAFSDVEILNK